MKQIVLVAAGGAIGSVLRYQAGIVALRLFGTHFPWGTLFVNVTGSLMIGIFVEVIARAFDASMDVRVFLVTGVLGGYTTFSAFALDAVALSERGELATAFAYVAASVTVSIAAVFAGLALARAIL
ncbi:fluoride efflux transporter CrcB [Ensifer soli]|uniref:fluoride efflux transporter CrcB n=1 Tax=Ciceribacter sp. sgz301302 TaxID=3342379 RepID=UPI0035BB7B9E